MLYLRYEVLLPASYNDGTPIEQGRISLTIYELYMRFGGLTHDIGPMIGYWVAPSGEVYQDEVARLVIDVPDTPENRDFFVQWKDTLKDRFQQVEIWIVAISLEVI